MYKGASRALLHAHGVDRPDPRNGVVNAPDYAADLIAECSTLSLSDTQSEKKRCVADLARFTAENAAAKATGDSRAIAMAGERIQVVVRRLSALNLRLKVLQPMPEPQRVLDTLRQAMAEILDEATVERVWARSRALRAGEV